MNFFGQDRNPSLSSLKWHNSAGKPEGIFGHRHWLLCERILQTQVDVVQ